MGEKERLESELRRAGVTIEDLEIVEQSLRRLAWRYRNDARDIGEPGSALNAARECERIAERIAGFHKV